MRFLENLRKKPNHVKANLALSGAFAVTAFVAVIWMSTLPARIQNMGFAIAEQSGEQTAGVQNSFNSFLEQAQESLEVEEVFTDENEFPVEAESYDQQGQASALGNIGEWKEARSAQSESSNTMQNFPNEQQNPAVQPTSTASKPTVILIGTTTKKAE